MYIRVEMRRRFHSTFGKSPALALKWPSPRVRQSNYSVAKPTSFPKHQPNELDAGHTSCPSEFCEGDACSASHRKMPYFTSLSCYESNQHPTQTSAPPQTGRFCRIDLRKSHSITNQGLMAMIEARAPVPTMDGMQTEKDCRRHREETSSRFNNGVFKGRKLPWPNIG